LPFAVFPLVYLTSNKKRMGVFANPVWMTVLAVAIACVITLLNVWLIANVLSA